MDSTMDMLKGRPRRTASPKTQHKAFRLSGRLFNRNPRLKSEDQLHSTSSNINLNLHHTHSHSPSPTRPRSNIEHNRAHSFQGPNAPIPPEEPYYGPESFSCFRDEREVLNINLGLASPQTSISNGSLLTLSPQSSYSASSPNQTYQAQTQTRIHNSRPQSQQTHSYSHPQPNRDVPRGRSRSTGRTYAQDLHLRSRSPNAFAPQPSDRHIPSTDPFDPANRLGTFRENPRTSRIGDQERPWMLSIPGDGGEETTLTDGGGSRGRSRSTRRMEETEYHAVAGDGEAETDNETHYSSLPRYEQLSYNPPTFEDKPPPAGVQRPTTPTPAPFPTAYIHPTRGPARTLNTKAAIELPVRGDDDSNEEITMSSTAYPGQEWRPLGLAGWDYQY